MDIIKDAYEALLPLANGGIEVRQGWYDENLKKTHVTLWDLGENEANYSDDEAEHTSGEVQVTIFSTNDEVELAAEIKKHMKQNGFDYLGRNADDADPKNGIYLKAQRFAKLYEREE